MEIKDLERNVEEILERNKRVELDKKWETIYNEFCYLALCKEY